jgi:hypothetical protein
MATAPSQGTVPRAVIAMPVFNEEAGLAEALESLLAQTEERLRIVVIDNASTDASAEIAAAFAGGDRRVTVERNGCHLGAVDNWRRAFWRARQLHSDAAYFAWAGGHDRWQPHWLETLAGRLDADASLVGAFPLADEIDDQGRYVRPAKRRGGTVGLPRARDRMAKQLPGIWVHSLFRPVYLERIGVAPAVRLPDRLTMALLASQGELAQVDERLWLRRIFGPTPSWFEQRVHQRRTLFTGYPPLHSRLPWPLVHAGVLVWMLTVRGNGSLTRLEGLEVASHYLLLSTRNLLRSPREPPMQRVRERLRRASSWRAAHREPRTAAPGG